MQTIPFKTDPQFTEEITLDGVNYVLVFKWNTLNEYWVIDIRDEDLDPIAMGIKIVTQFNLTEQIIKDDMPAGDIICQNIVGGFEKIARYAMGETNELVYYSQAG